MGFRESKFNERRREYEESMGIENVNCQRLSRFLPGNEKGKEE